MVASEEGSRKAKVTEQISTDGVAEVLKRAIFIQCGSGRISAHSMNCAHDCPTAFPDRKEEDKEEGKRRKKKRRKMRKKKKEECILQCVYIYICCEVIIWAKFCHFRCYYLGQVGVIIWAKLFLAYKNSGFKRLFAHTVII